MFGMKDTGVEWIGKIPESWEVGKIKHYYSFITGFTPDTTKSEYYDINDGFTWVSISDMNGKDEKIYSSKEKVSKLYISEKHPQIVPKGSLLYSFKLSVGKTAFAGKDLYTNEAISSFLCKKGSNLSYLKHASFLIEENSNINIYGAMLLNSTLIANSYTIFPPLTEQQAIANFLDDRCKQIDSIIFRIEKQIELLKEYKISLITETVTKGLDKSVPMKDSGIEWIGDIPATWEIKRLKYLSILKTGGTPTEKYGIDEQGDYPWITASDFDNGVDIVSSEQFISDEAVKLSSYKLFPTSSILLVCIASVGKIGMIHQPSYANQQITAIMPRNIYPRYLMYYMFFASDKIKDDASSNVVPIVNSRYLSNVKIAFANSYDIQKRISDYLDDKCMQVNKVIKKKEKQLELIKEHKNSLIFEYVTGKKRVEGYHGN